MFRMLEVCKVKVIFRNSSDINASKLQTNTTIVLFLMSSLDLMKSDVLVFKDLCVILLYTCRFLME